MLVAAVTAFAQKPDYNPNRAPILEKEPTEFGAKPNVRILASSSNVLQSKPLFYLDGEEVSEKKVYEISNDRIESITILKDEEATSKYGERAKRGVILITTKRKNNTDSVLSE